MNPFTLVALKQRVGSEYANEQALPILIYLDAVCRGHGFIAAENALVRIVVIAQVLASRSGNRALYNVACAGGKAVFSAASRGRDLLAFTTGEHKAVHALVRAYLRILPMLEVAMFVHAASQAESIITGAHEKHQHATA